MLDLNKRIPCLPSTRGLSALNHADSTLIPFASNLIAENKIDKPLRMKLKINAGLGLIFLFGGRASGVVVAILFIPVYAKLLDANEFGLATLVMTGQLIALAFDFGMSALIARDAAAQIEHHSTARQLRNAEALLIGIYILALPISLGIMTYFKWPIWQITACMGIYLALALQNLYLNFMLGRSLHRQVAINQSIGVIARALLTAGALSEIDSTLTVFVISQLLGAAAHMIATRWLCHQYLGNSIDGNLACFPNKTTIKPVIELARRGFPLFLVGITGALTINADKPIVGYFFGAESLAPYFLAATFSLTPIGLLAGPVGQYFQPKIVQAYLSKDSAILNNTANQLVLALTATVVVPTVILWIYRDGLVSMWLRQDTFVKEVSELSSWLLPAAAVGAIGNLPLSIVMAAGDYGFHAKLSIALAALVLGAVTAASAQGTLSNVCMAYLCYYVFATTALWWRCMQYELARAVAVRTGLRLLLALLFSGALFYGYSLVSQQA